MSIYITCTLLLYTLQTNECMKSIHIQVFLRVTVIGTTSYILGSQVVCYYE